MRRRRTARARRDAPEVRFVARRRRGVARRLLAVLVLAGVSVGGLFAADAAFEDEVARGTGRGDGPGTVTGAQVDTAQPPPQPAPTAVFGAVGELVLREPSTETLVVGYHEASRTGALAVTPVGRAVTNANPTRFEAPPADPDGADYHVMSSRGRVLPPTSAVDLVLAVGDPVLAPVDGTVTQVRNYRLYGKHADTRVEIRPDAAPHLRVVLIHLDDVAVARGDTVAAGRTPLAASANAFPFTSHVDRYLDERRPHVHLEVKDPRLAEGG